MDLVDGMTFTGVAPGRRSLEGLQWLGRVGASPVEPWRLVMGWSERVARDHVQRLETAGLVERVAMRRGQGVLVVASSRGAREAGYPGSWAPRSIGPSNWAHACGCAWASAWLELRDRAWWSERQVKDSDFWRREVTYRDRRGTARVTHRPDLGVRVDGKPAAVEVELQRKPRARLLGILQMYAELTQGEDGPLAGVLYITGNDDIAGLLGRVAKDARLDRPRLTVRPLGVIVEQAREAARTRHAIRDRSDVATALMEVAR
ncbi:MAG TPA: hypothetical protein VIJ51_16930 [Solirubrobacteraceae bacterium]